MAFYLRQVERAKGWEVEGQQWRTEVDVYKIRDLLEIYNPLNVGQSKPFSILLSRVKGSCKTQGEGRKEVREGTPLMKCWFRHFGGNYLFTSSLTEGQKWATYYFPSQILGFYNVSVEWPDDPTDTSGTTSAGQKNKAHQPRKWGKEEGRRWLRTWAELENCLTAVAEAQRVWGRCLPRTPETVKDTV